MSLRPGEHIDLVTITDTAGVPLTPEREAEIRTVLRRRYTTEPTHVLYRICDDLLAELDRLRSAVAAEREACARIAEGWGDVGSSIAADIRAMGNT